MVETTKNIKATSFALPKEVFGVKINTQTIFDVIVSERASRRQGTHSVKSRGEVSGTGKKPHSQKGSGKARAGSKRRPQDVGGGVAWGPTTERNYTLKVNKKVRKLAFASALTLKANENSVIVHDFKEPKVANTKDLLKQIAELKLKKAFKKILIITTSEIVWKSISNLPKVSATRLSNLTVEAIVGADVIIFSKEEISKLGGKK